jgi:hypothetical protein
MKPSPVLQWIALALLIVAYGGLFGWLLKDTWDHSAAFDVRSVQTHVTPILSGALGLVLALALGVDPKTRIRGENLRERLRALFAVRGLLLAGAVVYLVSAIVGGIVWGIKEDVTPALVTTIVLTVAGYLAATVTAMARRGP